MKQYKVGFIGAGNMGGIIASAISKKIGGENVAVCCSTAESSRIAAEKCGCCSASFEEICSCEYIFFGFKPQVAKTIIPQVYEVLKKNEKGQIIVSMLAGVTLDTLIHMTDTSKVIRIMPNTPASVGEGVTLVCASDGISPDDMSAFCDLVSLTGKTDILPEKLFDAGTALSGCGPAYVYMFLEALADGAVKCGIPREKAEEYAARTVLGAAKLAFLSDKHTSELKDAVCSPGGSTIEGVYQLEKGNFRSTVIDAVSAAFEKSKSLGK